MADAAVKTEVVGHSGVLTSGDTSGPETASLPQRADEWLAWIRPRDIDDPRIVMAKVSIWLHWLAGLLAVALMAIPPTSITLIERITPLAAAAFAFTFFIHRFPWRDHDDRLFLGVSLLDTALVSLGVAFTGGPTSRYQPIFFLIVVFAAYFYRIPEAAAITAVVLAVFCAPLIYASHVPGWANPWTAGAAGVMLLVAAVIKETVLRVEHERTMRDTAEGERRKLYEDEVARSSSLQQKTRQLESILEMGNAFRLQLGLDALLAKIASAIGETGGFGAVVVRLFDEQTGAALCRAAYGIDWQIVEPPTPPELIRSLMDPRFRVSRSYLVEVHPSALQDPDKKPYLYVRPGVHAAEGEWRPEHSLLIPLETREHGLIGIISIDEPLDRRIPSIDTIQALEIFANLAATAIDNARLLEEASQAQALRELDRLKSDFLAAVSHDLRTPLTVIKGSVDLLEGEANTLSPLQTRLIDGISRNTDRLMGMVEQLLEMIQIQDGRIHLNRQLLDVGEVVVETVEAMTVARQPRGQTIHLKDIQSARVLLDRNRIQQVLTNLVGNACKYGPENMPVDVSMCVGEREVTVSVHDQGPGIPLEEQKRIFEKFYRGESDTKLAEGAGLGLAICRSLVELHGGHIWVDSWPGRGTTFSFSLPRSDVEA